MMKFIIEWKSRFNDLTSVKPIALPQVEKRETTNVNKGRHSCAHKLSISLNGSREPLDEHNGGGGPP